MPSSSFLSLQGFYYNVKERLRLQRRPLKLIYAVPSAKPSTLTIQIISPSIGQFQISHQYFLCKLWRCVTTKRLIFRSFKLPFLLGCRLCINNDGQPFLLFFQFTFCFANAFMLSWKKLKHNKSAFFLPWKNKNHT